MTVKQKGRAAQSEPPRQEFWQSYSDMMAALLLVFALVLAGASLQARAQYEEKQQIIIQQQETLNSLLGVRESIVRALYQEFHGTNLTVNTQTGAVAFDSNLMFDYGKSELTPSGAAFLNDFLPRYVEILLSEEFSPYVAEIIVEGHTDTDGGYLYNLELSQSRALAVASYFLSEEQTLFPTAQRDRLRQIVTANGRSWSVPVLAADGSIDMAASRRVEIQFRLKDDEMIQKMIEAVQADQQEVPNDGI